MQAEGRLIRGHVQQEPFRLFWKARPHRPGDEDAELTAQPQAEGRDCHVAVCDGASHQRGPQLGVITQAAPEHLADRCRPGGRRSRLADPRDLDRFPADGILHPYVDQVQVEHTEEHTDQSAREVARLAAGPGRGQDENADQIVDAALEPLDLVPGGVA